MLEMCSHKRDYHQKMIGDTDITWFGPLWKSQQKFQSDDS